MIPDYDQWPTHYEVPLTDYQPRVPYWVRTFFYWAALVSGALGTLTISLVAVWVPGLEAPVSETVGAIVGAISTIAGILGVVYRPRPSRPESTSVTE